MRAREEKGYAYVGEKGVYFDTARFPDYGKLGNIKLDGLKEGARVSASVEKRNPTDFLLWKFDDKLGWDTPWSKGFPGWHIECSAMSRSILGDQIDIHTGGIEHIPVHHNNEIAQSEASSGKKPFSRYWLHRAHLQIEGAKIAKSAGKAIYLADIEKKKFHLLAFRYLLLGSHYRSTASFTWDALQASQQAFLKLRRMVDTYPEGGTVPASYAQQFLEKINDDLNTAGVLASVWEMTKDTSLSEADIRAGIINADELLGLRLSHHDAQAKELYEKEFGAKVKDIPADVETLMTEREKARAEKRWDDADAVRAKLEEKGYIVKDEKDGPVLLKK